MERFLLKTPKPPQCIEKNAAQKASLDIEEQSSDIEPSGTTTIEMMDEDNMDNSCDHKKRTQKFRSAWLSKFPWLKRKSTKLGIDAPFCDFCQKFLTCNVVNIKRHEEAECHKKMIKTLRQQVLLPDVKKISDYSTKKDLVKAAELKTTMFFIEHNLPFCLITPFTNFVKSIAPDSEILKGVKFGKTKMTETTNKIILEEGQQFIADILKAQKFSIIIDETTDVSSKKCLVIVVRYFDFNCQSVRDRFLCLIELQSADSKSIFSEIMNVFVNLEIPLYNLSGFASDNASTMVGRISGVRTLLKNQLPDLFTIGCTCHSIHLCSAAASKKIPEHIEALARNFYVFFSHSSKRQTQFKEFQEYFNVKPHKLLKTCSTRWLSLEQVVSRILEQWTALKHYFISYQLDIHADLAHNIYKNMTDETQVFFCFLSYILKLTNKINLEYQSEETRIHVLLETIKMYFKTILSNFIKKDFIHDENLNVIDFKNAEIFFKIDDVYIGAKANLVIAKSFLTSIQIKEIKRQCRLYYIVLCEEILKRIDFNDKKLEALQILNPLNETQTLTSVMRLFPNLVPENGEEDLDEEWRMLLNLNNIDKESLPVDKYWSTVFNIKTPMKDFMFPNLRNFISSLLCLPHSSACAERIFSQVNLIKNKQRNCLLPSTVQSILMGKEIIKNSNSSSWMPSKAMLNKYTKK